MNTIESIDGVLLPRQPKNDGGYIVITSDLDSDSSGRSAETGTLLRYIIRQNVYKLKLSFRGQAKDIRKIKDMISKPKIVVKFWDLDKWVTADMYVSDRSQSLLPVPGEPGWYDFSFNLIQY